MPAIMIGLSLANAGQGGGVPVEPFSLSQLPADSVLDFNALTNVTADGSNLVSNWAAVSGTGDLATSTTAEKPTKAADAWSTGIPVIRFNGSSSGNIIRSSNIPLLENFWHFLAAARPSADQNGVATYKHIIEAGRLSNGYTTAIMMQRVTTDATQDKVYVAALGNGNVAATSGFAKGSKAVIWERCDTLRRALVNGAIGTGPTVGTPSSTKTGYKMGGSDDAVSCRAAIDIARFLRVNADLLPGKSDQLRTGYILEGFLAWAYGIQASLRSDHPFKNRAPVASDFTGNNLIRQQWGNSLANGTAGQVDGTVGTAALGVKAYNGGVGGETSTQIKTRFDAGNDSSGGTSSGWSTTDQRKRLTYIGDMFQNDAGGGVSDATGYSNLAAMVSAIETAQGVSAGNGHIVVWGCWRGNGEGSDSFLAAADARSAIIQAAYPNYFIDMGKELAKDAAPAGLSPDADASARGVIPVGYRIGGGDIIHLNTTGYARAVQIQEAFATANGWTL